MCSYSTEVGGVSSSLLGGECRLTVDSRIALTRHSTPDQRRVLPKSPSDTCRTWSGARAETPIPHGTQTRNGPMPNSGAINKTRH
jgi:hypothetical protein